MHAPEHRALEVRQTTGELSSEVHNRGTTCGVAEQSCEDGVALVLQRLDAQVARPDRIGDLEDALVQHDHAKL